MILPDDPLVKHLSGYVYRHMHFHEQYTNEAAKLLELQQGQCGCRARLLLGLSWAAGIVGRWLWCPGHSLTELFVDGEWVLFDSTVEKVYRKRGRLLTAFDVHEMFCAGKPELIDFGNKTLSEYRAICPTRGGGYRMQWVRLRDRKGGRVEQMLYKPPGRITFPWTLPLSQ